MKSGIERLKKANKHQINTLDKSLIFSFSVLIIYTISELIISSITQITHDTLTTCLYGAFGGELLLCAMLKRLKIKKGDVE